jgi:hypothetical protein
MVLKISKVLSLTTSYQSPKIRNFLADPIYLDFTVTQTYEMAIYE